MPRKSKIAKQKPPTTPKQTQHQIYSTFNCAPKKPTIRKLPNSTHTKQNLYSEDAKHGYFKETVGGKNPSSYFQTYKSKRNGNINYNSIVQIVANEIKQHEKKFFQETRQKHLQTLRKLGTKHTTARQISMRQNSNTPHKKACTAAYARSNGINKAIKNLERYRQLF